jgi:hypothetical protein
MTASSEVFEELKREHLEQIALSKLMHADLIAATDAWHKEPDSGFVKRNYIRIFCASCEASAFLLRQQILRLHYYRGLRKLDASELNALEEVSYDVESNGRGLIRREKWIPTKVSFRFTVAMLAKTLGSDFDLDIGEGYEAYKRTLAVRDNLAHPKSLDQFQISEQAAKDVCAAYEWFTAQKKKIWAIFTPDRVEELLLETGLYKKKPTAPASSSSGIQDAV